MRKLVLAAALLASGAAVAAQPSAAPADNAQGDLAVTIYNNNRALVEDRRTLNLPAGRSRQEFRDVSAQIQPETVTLSGRGIGIVEQNFDFDLLTPAALMENAVGQTVTLVRVNPATGAEVRERAKILAANGGVVMQIGDHIEVLRDDGLPARVIFDDVPSSLRAHPTLSVTLTSDRAGPQPVTLTYLTPGLAWQADYVALFDEANSRMDVQGWITLTNNSGTPYVNASTLLVAGAVGQAGNGYAYRGGYPMPPPPPPPPPGGMVRPGTETAGRERIGDFYLYPLPERTTIADKQTKQVSFLDVQGTPATRAYEYRNGWLTTSDQPISANTILRFSSARNQGLGDALPAGTIRVYQRDARGNPQFAHGFGHRPRHRTGVRREGSARRRGAHQGRRQPLAHADALHGHQRRAQAGHRRRGPVGAVGRCARDAGEPQVRAAERGRHPLACAGAGERRSDGHGDVRQPLLKRCAHSHSSRPCCRLR